MEQIVDSIRAYDRECIGCQRRRADVMVSYTTDKDAAFWHELSTAPDGESAVHDLFLNQSQARQLHEELGRAIAANENAAKQVSSAQ